MGLTLEDQRLSPWNEYAEQFGIRQWAQIRFSFWKRKQDFPRGVSAVFFHILSDSTVLAPLFETGPPRGTRAELDQYSP